MSSIAFVIFLVDCTDLIRRRKIRSCPPATAPPFSLVRYLDYFVETAKLFTNDFIAASNEFVSGSALVSRIA